MRPIITRSPKRKEPRHELRRLKFAEQMGGLNSPTIGQPGMFAVAFNTRLRCRATNPYNRTIPSAAVASHSRNLERRLPRRSITPDDTDAARWGDLLHGVLLPHALPWRRVFA